MRAHVCVGVCMCVETGGDKGMNDGMNEALHNIAIHVNKSFTK